VQWEGADRARLEKELKKNRLIVVRYIGCEMEPLYKCNAKGQYTFSGVSPKQDLLLIQNVDELYANMPMGAFKLEGNLARGGQLERLYQRAFYATIFV
jgi:hypothetical protein